MGYAEAIPELMQAGKEEVQSQEGGAGNAEEMADPGDAWRKAHWNQCPPSAV